VNPKADSIGISTVKSNLNIQKLFDFIINKIEVLVIEAFLFVVVVPLGDCNSKDILICDC